MNSVSEALGLVNKSSKLQFQDWKCKGLSFPTLGVGCLASF